MTDPQGGVTGYVYDSLNRLTSATNPSGRATSFSYDALGRRTSMSHANGVVSSYSYDAASQLLSLVHQLGATTVNSFTYTYDAVGNRKTKGDNNGVANYTYDALNRLVQATNPLPSNPLETYTYDPVGNRTNSNQNGPSVFNQANQLTEDASFTYQYDANGNLTRKTAKVSGDFTTYEYDAENKLARVVTAGKTVNYRYDGLGRRVEKEIIDVATTVTRFVFDNEDILLELDGSNNITARYTHGPGIDEPLIMEKAGASFFYHADGLGSITEITDSTGAVAQRYAYSSFGKIESQLDPNFVQPYTFTAREFDPETGLYHYRKRDLDPNTGRFNQEDPILHRGSPRVPYVLPLLIRAPLTLHSYVYVRNSPVNLMDPFGLVLTMDQSFIASLGGTVGAAAGAVVGSAVFPAVGTVAGAAIGASLFSAAGASQLGGDIKDVVNSAISGALSGYLGASFANLVGLLEGTALQKGLVTGLFSGLLDFALLGAEPAFGAEVIGCPK